MAEAKQRETIRLEEEEKERKRRGDTSGLLGGDQDISESAMKWQMQIQEDVSRYIYRTVWYIYKV